MTKAPERIWAQHDTAAHMDTLREMAVKPVDEVAQAFTPYLRADRIETLEAENKRLREALTPWAMLGAALMDRWPDGGVDGFDLQEFGVEFGVLKPVPGGFDPKKHSDVHGVDPESGDDWFEVIPLPAALKE